MTFPLAAGVSCFRCSKKLCAETSLPVLVWQGWRADLWEGMQCIVLGSKGCGMRGWTPHCPSAPSKGTFSLREGPVDE